MIADVTDRGLSARYASHTEVRALLDEAYDALPPFGGLTEVDAVERVLAHADVFAGREMAEPAELVRDWYRTEKARLPCSTGT